MLSRDLHTINVLYQKLRIPDVKLCTCSLLGTLGCLPLENHHGIHFNHMTHVC